MGLKRLLTMFSPKKTLLKILTHPVQVIRIKEISPCLRLVRVAGEAIKNLSWSSGDKIKLRIGSKMRSYTPSTINCQEGWIEIIIFLHGHGIASEWASHVKVGDESGFMGPAKSMPMPDFSPSRVLFLGDETTIGLAYALFAYLPDSSKIEGAIELNDEDLTAVSSLNLSVEAVPRTTKHGTALSVWLTHWITNKAYQSFLNEEHAIIWISGEANTILSIKKQLLDIGISSDKFYIKPYWSIRGHSHRKAIQRQLK
jgi:ferric-chelate reductase (NADPH)